MDGFGLYERLAEFPCLTRPAYGILEVEAISSNNPYIREYHIGDFLTIRKH